MDLSVKKSMEGCRMAPNFLSPGVFTQEVQGKSGTVSPASTSTFAIAGYSPRGPEGVAYVHGSVKEYFDRFGSYSPQSVNAYIASAFFANGGSQLLFVRQLHSDATYASGSFAGTWGIHASGRGVWANGAEIAISGNPSFYDRQSATFSRFDLTVSLVDPSTNVLGVSESYEALNLSDPTDPDYLLNVLSADSEDVVFSANIGGIPSALQPVAAASIAVGTGDGTTSTFVPNFAGHTPLAETTVRIFVNGVLVSQDDGNGKLVSVSGGPAIAGSINYMTGAASITITPPPASTAAVTANVIQSGAPSLSITLAGGLNGSAVQSVDIVGGNLQTSNTGIFAFDAFPVQLALSIPDFVGDPVTDQAILAYASNRKDVVCIHQPPKGTTATNAARYKRNSVASTSSFGAMYWPWVKMADPLNGNRAKIVPAVGHIAGRYAYTDAQENVGKSPAGVTRGQLSLTLGLERVVTQNDRDIVYPAQVNPIRSDSEAGTAIWGNKTLQTIGDFTDVNVRRTFIFLEKSQQAALIDIVFEDIGPVTWGLITARLDAFLENLYLQGVIGSGVPNKAQAYKVICDSTNNSPAVQQAREIAIDEFIKPNLAAEFIYLKLQKVFDASTI
jgi:phage tail sheath protein FI